MTPPIGGILAGLMSLILVTQFTIVWRLGNLHADMRAIHERVSHLEGKIE